MNKIYTIGHSTYSLSDFILKIKKYKIDFLIDVRSVPYSKIATCYNKENIEKKLLENKVKYYFKGKVFGARTKDMSMYTNNYVDFEKIRSNKKFLNEIEKIICEIEKGKNIALMCAEKDPINCHRAILIGKAFYDKGINVEHIMPNGSLMNQTELEKRMLKMYFPDINQINIFDNYIKDEKYYIEECYKIRNKEIGYRKNEEEDEYIYNGLY